jgi:hypothetical protein
MWLERPALLAVAALAIAGCGGARDPEVGPATTYDYLTAVRPLAYDNARAACRGHSLASLAYEYGSKGSTFATAARSWAVRNQPDVRLRDVSFRGCRGGLRETASRPVLIDKPPPTDDEIDVYIAEYATCLGLTLAELVQDYGLDPQGLTLEEAVREVVRRSYEQGYRTIAFEACLAAIRGEPPRYGS